MDELASPNVDRFTALDARWAGALNHVEDLMFGQGNVVVIAVATFCYL